MPLRFFEFLGIRSSFIKNSPKTKEKPISRGMFTREVYDFVSKIQNVSMVTPPNPDNLPIPAFEFKHDGLSYHMKLFSLNPMDGVDIGGYYDTGVYSFTILTGWIAKDSTLDQVNEWNKKNKCCYAVKDEEYVELISHQSLFPFGGFERQLIESSIVNIVCDNEKFVEHMVSYHRQ